MNKSNTTFLKERATEIKERLCNKDFLGALELISSTEKAEDSHDIIRSKALAENAIGKYEKSLESIEEILEKSEEEADWHIAGELSLELGYLEKSCHYLTKAIELSLEKNTDYYLSTCYLERAYIYSLLGEKSLSINDLEKIDEDINIFWLKGVETISKKIILQSIS